MATENNNIELRSEKARRIIGEVPPLLVRSGIGIITAVVIALLVAASTITCPESVTVHAVLTSYHNGKASLTLAADSLTASRLSGSVRFSFDADTWPDSHAAVCGTITKIVSSSPLTVIASIDSLSPCLLPVDSTLHGQCRLLLNDRTLISTVFNSVR